MVPEDRQGRIVLVSDGVENEGNVAGMLDDLKSRHIAVDVLPIQYEYQHEVWLERLDLPRQGEDWRDLRSDGAVGFTAAG